MKAVGIGEHIAAIERRVRRSISTLEGDRFRAREAIAALIAPWFAARTLARGRRRVRSRRRVLGPLPDVRPAARRGLAGVGRQPRVPRHRAAGRRQGSRRRVTAGVRRHRRDGPRPAPRLGEHTEQVLSEVLRLDHAGYGRLVDRGIAAGLISTHRVSSARRAPAENRRCLRARLQSMLSRVDPTLTGIDAVRRVDAARTSARRRLAGDHQRNAAKDHCGNNTNRQPDGSPSSSAAAERGSTGTRVAQLPRWSARSARSAAYHIA